MLINISLNTANLNAVDISSPKFQVWQHQEDHWMKTHLHKLADIPTVPIAHLYKHMISNNGPILPFQLADESKDDTESIWTPFSLTGIYVMAIGLLILIGLGIFCCYLFLVLTCYASALTFTIRFYVTYYCGWWCRGSTHLHKQQHGWTAYSKTSQESWPALKMGTYTDRKSTETPSTVKSSSLIRIIE